MCGIFGWIKFDSPLSGPEIDRCRIALASLAHRGPDGRGEKIAPFEYVGHRRLSVIDLSPEAGQPFLSDDGRWALAYNGEIYNYLELNRELNAEGRSFRTRSDTETFLQAFLHWGPDAVRRFDGMFAAAVHDLKDGVRWLVRDPFGQKPLYYHPYENGLIYASELRALLALDGFQWRADRRAFAKFLLHGYFPWDLTPLEGVKKLPPGHRLEIQRGGRIELRRYWDSKPGEDPLDLTFEEAGNEFRRLFDRSCEISMRSDVPYGVFHSGGVDSTLVLDSCLRRNQSVPSFTVSMGERDFDEWDKARESAAFAGTRPTAYKMDFEAVKESVEAFFRFLDEPHGDPGFVNAWFLARSCRDRITVALAGDGADELFAGYLPFLALRGERAAEAAPGFALRGLEWAAGTLLKGGDGYVGPQFKALSFLQGFPASPSCRFPAWLGSLGAHELQRLCPSLEPGFFETGGGEDTIFEEIDRIASGMEGKSRVQQFLYFYQKFFLPEFVCLHTDRAAMQHGLEVRSPFLSVPLAEFANRLPDPLKVSGGELKRLLKTQLRERGFPRTVWGQKKQGFTFPVARWLKSALKDKMDALLAPEKWEGSPVDAKELARLKALHLSGRRNHYRILFNLMVYRRWLENFPNVSL